MTIAKQRNYEERFEKLTEVGIYKNILTGSPKDKTKVYEVKGESLKEIWDELWEVGCIETKRYTKETPKRIIKTEEEYKENIKEYITDKRFYYKKYNW